MVQPTSDSAIHTLSLEEGWSFAITPPGAWAEPPRDDDAFRPAIVPGTAAQALAALGIGSLERPEALHDKDVWYRVTLPGVGPCRLDFGGLATIAEIWFDGAKILDSESMYLASSVEIVRGTASRLTIAFRSLDAALAARKAKRARWRSTMIDDARLRLVRTTLLGHMPGWCPSVDAVGPYRPILLSEGTAAPIRDIDLRSSLDGSMGRIELSFAYDGPDEPAFLVSGAHRAPLVRNGDRLTGGLDIADAALWWPASHGEPVLHPVAIEIGDRVVTLPPTGFRTITIDRGADGNGFQLVVNGVPIFCRGAVWTPADLVSLSGSRAAYEPLLKLAREAGINMLRVGGTMLYESAEFPALCDELGILVWQDLMFANFDYPADDAFLALVRAEAAQLLDRLQASPSLAVACGGSEVAQQAAMMGLPPAAWSNAIVDTVLPEAIAAKRPDLSFVPSSPFGGEPPFVADQGVTHYYGVGAYRRPLEDARRAHVRFASECLAFANVPDDATLRAALTTPAVHSPRWKAAVPRDLGASWDFEDVREHYTALLYGVDGARLRTEDPKRYLDLARATTADVVEATIGEWRRPGSETAGALVWFFRDLMPGAGWGVVDALGRPKSIYHAMKRAFRPVKLQLIDEGVNGLDLSVVNDGAEPIEARLAFSALRDGRVPVASGERAITVPARGGITLSATELLGAFFDTTYAYRFGPAGHDVSLARLTAPDGTLLDQATHWLPGKRSERQPLGLKAELVQDEQGWTLALSAERMAAHVHVDDDRYRALDDGFDLAPGAPRIVRLLPFRPGEIEPPEGEVRAINGVDIARYGG